MSWSVEHAADTHHYFIAEVHGKYEGDRLRQKLAFQWKIPYKFR